jgi:hypothetical protein
MRRPSQPIWAGGAPSQAGWRIDKQGAGGVCLGGRYCPPATVNDHALAMNAEPRVPECDAPLKASATI